MLQRHDACRPAAFKHEETGQIRKRRRKEYTQLSFIIIITIIIMIIITIIIIIVMIIITLIIIITLFI